MSGKVLFGTDWPAPGVASIRKNLETIASLPLSEEALRRILQDNSERLFPPG